jgi:hypothetical protein
VQVKETGVKRKRLPDEISDDEQDEEVYPEWLTEWISEPETGYILSLEVKQKQTKGGKQSKGGKK